jgi:2-dehydro-3-deoxyphosphogluconate aldolase / (4S)-4-hydroxy-2-oxoglutarate aldolase
MKDSKERSVSLIIESGIVPVFYHEDAEVCRQVVKACFDAGLRVFEFTNRGPKAFDNFKSIKEFIGSNCQGMLLGAGTIFNNQDAKTYLDAGANFIVSPALIPEMSSIQKDFDKLWIPGCATVTELASARSLGAIFMKAFPADLLGPSFISSALSVMPKLAIMPTGGVDPTQASLTKWFHSGVAAVGMGSQLFSKEIIAQKDWQGLSAKVKDTLAIVSSIKMKK